MDDTYLLVMPTIGAAGLDSAGQLTTLRAPDDAITIVELYIGGTPSAPAVTHP